MIFKIKSVLVGLVLSLLFSTVVVGAVPDKPTNLREFTGTEDKNISIGWDLVSSGIDAYNVYYAIGSIADGNLSYHLIETIGKFNSHYMVDEVPITSGSTPGTEALRPYTQYRFSVSATNGDGESEKSDIFGVKTLHTWHDDLKDCLNTTLSRSPDNIPDRQDVESVTTFACSGINIFEAGTIDEMRDLIYVRDLNLSNSNIYLPFPDWITELTHLFSLRLNGGYLTGSIPQNIGNSLLHLLYLNLSDNKISGPIPNTINNMLDLTYLNLESNDFNGTVPASLGNLVTLTTLKLKDNNLSGELPYELSQLLPLLELTLGGNNFNSLPEWIGDFPNLRSLNLDNWSLKTSLPTLLKKLTLLEYLSMENCNLQGHLPQWIDTLAQLKELNLRINNMFGTVPKSILNLNLSKLNLKGNCNLFSHDSEVQEYIRQLCDNPIAGCDLTTYEMELPYTNTHQCDMGMTPIRYFLLD